MDLGYKALKTQKPENKTLRLIKKQKLLIALAVPFLVYVIVFSYVPIIGWFRAFINYVPGQTLSESQFVGFKYFNELFSSPGFWTALRNTLALAFMNMVFGTIITITFAVLLNEVMNLAIKRVLQTVSYLPHFVSWVIVTGIFIKLLSVDNGMINDILLNLHLITKPIQFLLKGNLFWIIVTSMGIWKELGWGAIIYLAVISSINPELYEAAVVDGANRFRRIWHVTLPALKKITVLMLVLQAGWVLGVGFEQSLLMSNGAIIDYSDVLSTYILRYGITLGRFSFATAASIFQSIVGVVLVLFSNFIAKRFGDTNLFGK
jgi:putative aldouronate transport system permease protein